MVSNEITSNPLFFPFTPQPLPQQLPPKSLSNPYFLLKIASTFLTSLSSNSPAFSCSTSTYCGQSITVTLSSLTKILYSLKSQCTTPFAYATLICSRILSRYHSGSSTFVLDSSLPSAIAITITLRLWSTGSGTLTSGYSRCKTSNSRFAARRAARNSTKYSVW